MPGKIKSLSIRIDEELLHKLHIVADYEGRSANSQILILIRNAVVDYEAKNGKIELKPVRFPFILLKSGQTTL